jgi:hypothetical protein
MICRKLLFGIIFVLIVSFGIAIHLEVQTNFAPLKKINRIKIYPSPSEEPPLTTLPPKPPYPYPPPSPEPPLDRYTMVI